MDGVERCGGAGRWQEIKRLEYHALMQRSAVDLKDKWRNLLRVANLPQLHCGNSKADKKREAPSLEILARVSALNPSRPPEFYPIEPLYPNRGTPSTGPRSWSMRVI